MSRDYDGLILAGGRSVRMGGRVKPTLEVSGRSMLGSAVGALANARQIVVVGPDGDVCEYPPHGGPVAALAAGLKVLKSSVVAVLAADLPFVTVDAVETLVRQASAVAVDDAGHPQYLLAAYRTAELRSVLPDLLAGQPMRGVVDLLTVRSVKLAGHPPPWWDCDTPRDLEKARRWT